ncbi:MAG: zinc ABC transporter substrate-binding protein [Anaerolineae bacterium]|nr:zinc ABC transporter substrate-binding protein [Anaerolineae bacterium]
MEIPNLTPALLADGERLHVVASFSIVGDVVQQVGGDRIDLTVIIGAGQDGHTYEATPADIAALEGADVIFVNGLDFEEGLVAALDAIHGTPIVPVSAGVSIREGEEAGHADEADTSVDNETHTEDPHVWQDPRNVTIWADNIAAALSALDPANAEAYQANAEAYQAELARLDASIEETLASIPEARRKLVTTHDTFGYFADRYGFEVIGAVIPSVTTGSEPTAGELAALVETLRAEQVQAIFAENVSSAGILDVLAAETGTQVTVYSLYTDALSEPGNEADSYVRMMTINAGVIAAALGAGQ